MPFLHTWSAAGPDSEEHNEKARCHPFSLQRGTDKKVHTLKVKGNAATDTAGAAELSTSPNRSGSVLVFPAGAHRSLHEWEIHCCCCSLCSLLSTLGKPASEHPKRATGWWQTHRFREDLLDWNCKLLCNERDRAHGTPLAAAPRLWHHLSWRKYEINIFIYFFSEKAFILKPTEYELYISSFPPSPPPTSCPTVKQSELLVISVFGGFHLPGCFIDYQRSPSEQMAASDSSAAKN